MPERVVLNAIELGINILGWYGSSFSTDPRSSDAKAEIPLRILLDDMGMHDVIIPDEQDARKGFLDEISLRLSVSGKYVLSNAVRFGYAIAAYDQKIASPKNLQKLLDKATELGISEGQINALISERRSIHQPDQADILLRHVHSWIVDAEIAKRIFVVHGHDEGPRESVARFLEKIGLRPVILHERPNRGRTIITKFCEEAADVGFAIVLMTPDDIGGNAGQPRKPRARQNVIFELGFFIGKLGINRVASLVKGDVERPSDFDGVVYIPMNDESWKQKLGLELDAAGYKIDWNTMMRL